MMKNSLASPGPLVIPLEALSAANGLLPPQANRFSLPFVSLESSHRLETSRMAGNTSQPIFVPVIVGGARLLETLLPMMRKTGLIPIFGDENFSKGENFSEASGAWRQRLDNFLQDLLWMVAALRQRLEQKLSN
jgi:hypothetical protein